MTKGYIQLSFIGKQDYKLVGNPQICFWKKVYKRHTNFSSQSIEIECDDSVQLLENKKSTYTFKLKRYADMINFISLTLDLPEIDVKEEKYFKWITNIGANIIKSARLFYDDILIEEIDGDFILINKDMNYTSAQAETFDKLIGNISEIYTPITKSGKIYPYRLNIPLPFCFFRDKTYIPLLCNNLREVSVEITLRALNDLYLIGTVNTSNLIPPSPSQDDCGVLPGSGICMPYIQWNKQKGCGHFDTYSHAGIIKPNIEANYIYLDNDERNTMSKKSLIQILPIVKRYNFNELIGKVKLYIDAFHPLKSLYIIAKKNNIDCMNQWDNYTNKDYSNQEILFLQTYLLTYIKNEFTKINSNHSGENFNSNDFFVSLLGGLLPYGDGHGSTFRQNTNAIISVNDNGEVEDIKLLNKGSDYTKKPSFNIKSTTGENVKLESTMKITKVIIKHSGNNYIKNPSIVSSDKRIIAESVITEGKLTGVRIRGSVSVKNLPILTVQPTFYINTLNHLTSGRDYKTSPYILVFLNEDLRTKDFTSPIVFKGKLNNGRIVSSIRIKQGETNKDEKSATVFIGGILNEIIPNKENRIYDSDFNMPTLHFHDRYNNILSPEVVIKDNKAIIKTRGAGLSKYTEINIGRILYGITDFTSELFKETNITAHLEYKYYKQGLTPSLNCSKKPIINVSIPNITGILPKYELVLRNTFISNSKECAIPDTNDIFIEALIINSNLIVKFDNRFSDFMDLVLELQLYKPSVLNDYLSIKRFTPDSNKVTVPIKLILNHEKDISSYMNELGIFQYDINRNQTAGALFITHKIGSIRSLPKILKIGDVITLVINNIYVATCSINIVNNVIFGWDFSKPINIMNILMHGGGLYFNGLGSNPFVFDVSRPLKDFKLVSNGYNISSPPKMYIKSNTHSPVPIECNIDTHPISHNTFELDYGGKGASAKVEFDFGGTMRQLNDYITVEIHNGKVRHVKFNQSYYDISKIWENYSSPPLFIYKSKLITANYPSKDTTAILSKADKIREYGILDISHEEERTERYEDALIGGIIDTGGEGFEGNIIYDHGGFGAKLILEEGDKNHFNVVCSNMGYNYTENVISSVIAYNIDDGGTLNTRMVYQFKSSINNIGQIDTSKKYVNNKFNKIFITHEKTTVTKSKEYSIVDSAMNINTRYFLVTGNIPDKSINIISSGKNYKTQVDNSVSNDKLEFKLFSHPKFLDNSKIGWQYTINNGSITTLNIKSSNSFVPFVKYIYIPETGIQYEKLNTKVSPKLKLTGFKVIDGGNGIINRDEMFFYNGFITELSLIDKGKSYRDVPKAILHDSHRQLFLDVELEKAANNIEVGRSISKISYPNNHKLLVINHTGHSILSKYKNISLSPLLSSKTRNFILFNTLPSIRIGGEITKINLGIGNNLEDMVILGYNKSTGKYIEDDIIIKKRGLDRNSYFIKSSTIHSNSSKIMRKTEFNDLQLLQKYDNIGFTRASYIDIGYPLSMLDINYLGDEIASSKFGYELVMLNKYNERINEGFSPNIIIRGENNPIKGNEYSINVRGDGGGVSATAEPEIMKGDGAIIMASGNTDGFNILNPGKGYTCDDEIISSGGHYEWSSISEDISIPEGDLMTKEEIIKFLNIWSFRDKNNIPIIDSAKKYDFYSSDIIKRLGVMINNEVREDLRLADYYKTVEKFFTSPNSNYNNIYEYSASLNNLKFQPMGTINLETLNKFAIVLELLNPLVFESYKYDVSIFTMSYNAIKYINGEGSLVYGN